MGKELCNISTIGEDFSLIDKLVKMYVSKIFTTDDICHFGFASLTAQP